MSDESKKDSEGNLSAHNYCVGFVDLLGQRDALKNQGLLPIFDSDEDRKRFGKTIKDSIGAIINLQSRADSMFQDALADRPNSPLREKMPDEQKSIWDEMAKGKVTTQRWSDGIVSFVNLGDSAIKCPLNGVFSLFGTLGSLCFMGLASEKPIRGAIDVAWAVEIHPGELYGAAVVRAYELESEVAQYPRIVVSERTIHFLEANRNNTEEDVFSQNNRGLADICLSMIAQDTDGTWILNYLGHEFKDAVSYKQHDELYKRAYGYIEKQLAIHQKNRNSKLAFRYSHLLWFYDAHPISET